MWIIRFIIFVWQLPQHFLALFVWLVHAHWIKEIRICGATRIYFIMNGNFGVSLGDRIFIPEHATPFVVGHERGHSIQSKIFGPLYLVLVGIPSFAMNVMSSVLFRMGRPKFAENYYNRWPESWANSLSKKHNLEDSV